MKNRKAFTLWELLLVVLLLGIVYTAIPFSTKEDILAKPSSINDLFHENESKIVIYDNCTKIARFTNDKILSSKETCFFCNSSLVVYQLDKFASFEPIKFPDQIINGEKQNTCLIINHYANGTIDSLLIQLGNNFFYLGPFKEDIQQFFDISEAQRIVSRKSFLPFGQQSYHE